MTPVSAPVAAGVRQVLAAPRGQRFTRTRTGTRPTPHQERVLAQMGDNPRVAHRLKYGELPLWMEVAAERHQTSNPVPQPRAAPDEAPSRPAPERPALPRRPRSHRKPRRRFGWALTAYTLSAAAGALTQHGISLLL